MFSSGAGGLRLRHVLLPTIASLVAAAATAIHFAPYIAVHPAPTSGLALVFLISTGLSLVTYRESRRADREVELRADLIREVHHRVRNETVMLLALVDNEIAAAKTDETREALTRDRHRIVSVLSTHRHLLHAADRHAVPLDEYLSDVIQPITVDLVVPDRRPSVHYAPSGRLVPSSDAVTIGLLLNELLSNAVKHSSASSAITIAVTAAEPRGMELRVHNTLPEPQARVPSESDGFGLQFVQRLVESADGRLLVDEGDGFAVQISLPAIRSEPAPEAPRA